MADMPEGAENPLSSAVVSRDKSTLDMVRDAIRHNQTLLAFQPIMQSVGPQSVAFYEGYIRVLDSTGRVIPARDFMPHVEETETGRELDCLALDHGLKALAHSPGVRLSINMSARSIGYQRWMRVLDRHLKKDPHLGERLVLEITEDSAMAAPELVIDFMDRMQKHGIAFALDNFGAGITKVSLFRNFFFDAVKIDGQFVRNIHADHDNQAIVRALTGIAKQFDMLVVAESVENPADAQFLISIGVDCMQGFLFGAPSVTPPWLEELRQKSRASA
ncbi:EAL domain-containing protein [Phaeobacter sp.]|uniref:EAL domain-containing protein n=1 Tax=Phaeobacter sp. TaxID=1902409 RepID=UPI0025F9AE4F|nr:EAL domain-containing protein [Phaeobacter sp.]